MLTRLEYENLVTNGVGAQDRFADHFSNLMEISKEIANVMGTDWRKGFFDAIEGEMKFTDSGSHKVIYLSAFLRWLVQHVDELER